MSLSHIPHSLFLLLSLLLLASCANYKLNYLPEAENWRENTPADSLKLRHSIYLVGDVGGIAEEDDFWISFQHTLAQAPKASTVVFLGDNLYPSGMPPKSDEKARKQSEEQLDVQLNLLKDYKGQVLFVPGNHDWTKYGLEGLKRQEKYIEHKLEDMHDLSGKQAKHTFLPDDGCSGPEVVEINDQLVIIAIDSEWWLEDWDEHIEINTDCEHRNRESFLYYFEEALRKYRTRNVVVVMHHPIYSNGSHGGYLTAKEHLFPFTQYFKRGYIPFPVIGSLGSLVRKLGLIKQDLGHPLYKDLRTGLVGAASKNGSYIFAAGHEHNLQYWEKEEQSFIVSGSGVKTNAVKAGDESLFAYARQGFARLDFYEDGSAWVNFIVPDPMGRISQNTGLVFRHQVKGKLEILEEYEEADIQPFEDSITVKSVPPTTTPVRNVSKLAKPVAGQHYRSIYSQIYDFPTLNLETFAGGVRPVKMGGGRQTNSLRLEAKDGKQYAMRALTKDASRLLPYPLNEISFAQLVAQDVFLATHPFGALAIPPLADAAKVYHTNPNLYYIPKQPALEKYNAFFGDEVYLIEERPDDDRSDISSFGHSTDII
ncbi:MAG: metallophosphoesterase, partial [Bacteroidota bacterium]